MGTVAVANATPDVVQNKRVVECDITLSSSYATGGDSVPLSAVGLREVHDLHVLGKSSTARAGSKAVVPSGVQVVLAGTPTAPLLKVYNGSTSEVAAATNLSALVLHVQLHGI